MGRIRQTCQTKKEKISMDKNTYHITQNEDTTVWVGKSIEQLQKILIAENYTSYFILCDQTTKKLFGEIITKQVDTNKPVHMHMLPVGEDAKQTLELMRILEHMVEVGLDKKSVVLALGGGTVGDIATVAAGLFYRGIDCIQIPTTLLSQVDASIGGKGAVNMRKYKNMIGVITQPKHIIIDTTFLETLPKEQYKSGLGEISKYAIALNTDLFEILEKNEALDEQTLADVINRCIAIKMHFVTLDPLDKTGQRALLNFGHTIGHAVELTSKLSHGEAVAIGMVAALSLSQQRGMISQKKVDQAKALLKKYDLPLTVSGVTKEDIFSAIKKDKKTINGTPKFVLLEDLGKAKAGCEVSQEMLEKTLEEIIV